MNDAPLAPWAEQTLELTRRRNLDRMPIKDDKKMG